MIKKFHSHSLSLIFASTALGDIVNIVLRFLIKASTDGTQPTSPITVQRIVVEVDKRCLAEVNSMYRLKG